ncbi:hypothetical protein RND71_006219 [Anisodus tanguticus]|uniref:Pentatricopeptide repeat-containing protein n=1 Tax=Anisodus tanguticus TaxID=243964 RepID=A0AAE1SUL1_9SOLA|nr:hypothetical protein RND71_006219 [Anisodus tanguticus]
MMSCPKLGLDTDLDQSGIRVSPEIVEDVVKRFENAGMLAYRFFEWAEKQHNYEHSTKAYHFMIESLAKIRQYQMTWDLVNKMKTKGMLNIETFCIIMRKYARAQKVEEAVYTFNIMNKFDVPPNLAAFNGLLSALSKSKNVGKAQEIFDSKKNEFNPDSKTCSILIEGWGRAPNLPKAREIYREMIDVGCNPDIVTYGIMVDILCKAGRVDEAVEIVKEMDFSDCKPTSFIYSVLVNKFQNAYRVFNDMQLKGVDPNARTCNIILSGLIGRGESDDAFKVFRSMLKICDPDADTYTMMINMFCERNEMNMARKVWKYMKRKQFVPSMHTFSALINGMCDDGDAPGACVLMEEMIEKGMRPGRRTFEKLRKLLLKEEREDVLEFLQEKINFMVREPLSD